MTNLWLDVDGTRIEALAPNFTGAEFRCRCGQCVGFINAELLQTVQRLREATRRPLRINSGYRCPAYNARLEGSAKHSYHMLGMAVDVPWPASDLEVRGRFASMARACGFTGRGFYQSFIHLDVGPTRDWGRIVEGPR